MEGEWGECKETVVREIAQSGLGSDPISGLPMGELIQSDRGPEMSGPETLGPIRMQTGGWRGMMAARVSSGTRSACLSCSTRVKADGIPSMFNELYFVFSFFLENPPAKLSRRRRQQVKKSWREKLFR